MSRADAGFSLVEATVAAAILVSALAGLAQAVAWTIHVNAGARASTVAVMLAAAKMERLRSLAYNVDGSGTPETDGSTNTTVDPPAPEGGTGLASSPPDALALNRPGYSDFLDARGEWVGSEAQTASQASLVRRWSVTPAPGDPENSLVLEVVVASVSGRLESARLSSVLTRRAR